MKNSFLFYIYSNARRSEALNINNQRLPFLQRNARRIVSIFLSLLIIYTLPDGYNNDFLQLSASILSILIGLFITALVFALDKFYTPHTNIERDFELTINENTQTRKIELSIDELRYKNSREKLWEKQSLYYIQKFNIIVGKSVIVGVFALALICLNVIYYEPFCDNLKNYVFVDINLQSILVFLRLFIIGCIRFLICYCIIGVFYNTINIISSMVNFMSVKIRK